MLPRSAFGLLLLPFGQTSKYHPRDALNLYYTLFGVMGSELNAYLMDGSPS